MAAPATARARPAAVLLLLALAGCSTATPVLVQSGSRPAVTGRVNTTAGYTGVLTTDSGTCRGSFAGYLGQSAVPFEVSCSDGRSGIGRASIVGGAFVSAEVRLSDGALLTVRPAGPTFP